MDMNNIVGQYCDMVNADNKECRELLSLYKGTIYDIHEVVVNELNNDIAVDKILEILSVLEQKLEDEYGTEL